MFELGLAALFMAVLTVIVVGIPYYLSRKAKRELDQAIQDLGKWARFDLYLFDEALRKK